MPTFNQLVRKGRQTSVKKSTAPALQKGMNSLKNVFSPKIKQQLAEGKTVRVGKEGNFDLEAVIASKPDYIFVSASKYGGFESLKECGIPLISHHG